MEQRAVEPKSQKTTTPSECKICDAPALYRHFGVISCNPCKVFFKRNAQRGQEAFQCDSNDQCEININNRHICKSCRLRKCFASGMQVDMIRGPFPKRNQTKSNRNPIQTTSRVLVRTNEPALLPVLNLLRSDQSTFTIDEWNLLSNLTHCYDEHRGLVIGESYMREQYKLPLKSRFKTELLIELIQMSVDQIQLLYKNNRDFLSLSADDRSILLHRTMKYTAALAVNCVYHQVGLLNCPVYYTTVGIMTNPNVILASKRIAKRIHFDPDIIKLFLAILCFSTVNFTVYSNGPPINFSNIKEILRIQDLYVTLTWRYLLYKYKYEQSVIIFSDLIKCMFAIQEGVYKIEDLQWYTTTINSLAQKTEQTLVLND